MKRIKIADFLISVLLIIASVLFYFLQPTHSYLISYGVMGGWQLISMAFHEYNRCLTYKLGSRWIYHRVCLSILISLPFGSFGLLVFITPFLAVFYTYLCYQEVFVKMQRPLAVLK